jgi:Lon protease-like protein
MHLDFELPTRLPVMTLSDVVFFPQSILPLYIFEDRYRHMLEDVLRTNRLFAVACRDEPAEEDQPGERPCQIATVGVVRASHENADGTSNLVLQGICRVRVTQFSDADPYPMIEVRLEPTPEPVDPARLQGLRRKISHLIRTEEGLADGTPREFVDFLDSLEDPESFIDLTAFAACHCVRTKQRLLETVELEARYRTFLRYLTREQEQIRLQRRLQGSIDPGQIELN